MKRKPRRGEVVCKCGAYSFPHRMMGGRCTCDAFVTRYFPGADCRDCIHYEPAGCQVIEGLEPAQQCPALVAFIRYEGIKLYGVNKP